MKIKVKVAPDINLIKQVVVIEDEENPRNYLVITTHSARGSLQSLVAQLQEYLNEL